jgi:hypothetical protein
MRANRDATGGKDLVDMAQAQREPEIEPDGVADDLGREPVAGVGRLGGWRAHSERLLGRKQPAKPAQVDGAIYGAFPLPHIASW